MHQIAVAAGSAFLALALLSRWKPSFSRTWSEAAFSSSARATIRSYWCVLCASIDQGACRFGHVALAPERLAQPIAELGRFALVVGEADDADQVAVERDGVGPLVGPLRHDLDEAHGVCARIGAAACGPACSRRSCCQRAGRGRARRRGSARVAPAAWSRSCRAACRGCGAPSGGGWPPPSSAIERSVPPGRKTTISSTGALSFFMTPAFQDCPRGQSPLHPKLPDTEFAWPAYRTPLSRPTPPRGGASGSAARWRKA